MDSVAKKAIEEAEKDLREAEVKLKIVRILANVKPHLRRAVLELAADRCK